ncbi:26399_t:CDS:2 [Gigaspora margarita]|uniref:26399_t:CDS:1 n=1 Tax=Gigaspora margarita TaxID=4874 RepID=A0ABN7VWH1_GIGMA|nr:26399_t:CDS:2 [Gigaspora margarita]
MCQYIAGSKTGKRSRAGERYFEEFNSYFWERPGTRERNEDVSKIVTTSNNRDNRNNVNDVSGDSGRNTNGVCGDLDNATYSSSSELANITSKLNTSILRSDSDLSMPDIGSSQPPTCMENINEEN